MNIQYVNNTCADLDQFFPVFENAYKTGKLHEDFQDLFKITILVGFNADGTNRMVIDAA